MGAIGNSIGNWLPMIADVAATATGNPELIPLIHGGTGLAKGEGVGGALKDAGMAFAGQELLPVLGNAANSMFPETASSLGIGGGSNTLTDLFGQTGGGNSSFMGPGTIGGDLTGDFASGSGLSNLFGGAPSSDSGGMFGSATSNGATNSARDAVSSAASTPGAGLSGASTSSPLSGAGGGSAGGFVNAPDLSLGSFDNAFGTPTPAGGSITSDLASSLNPSGGIKMAGNNQMTNGLARSVLGGLFANTNQAGYQGENAAAQQAAQAYQPFLNNGTQASNTLANLYGNNGAGSQAAAQANFQNTPGYQFALNQGIQARDASAAAHGQLLSGNQQKALTDYGTGLADTTYQQYVNNLQNQAGQGLNAAGGYGGALAGGANALAQGGQARANNQNTALGGGLGALFPGSSIADLLKGSYGNGGILSSLFG